MEKERREREAAEAEARKLEDEKWVSCDGCEKWLPASNLFHRVDSWILHWHSHLWLKQFSSIDLNFTLLKPLDEWKRT